MEQVLDGFYGTYPYPWRPMRFDVLADPRFYPRFLHQDLGDYAGARFPDPKSIWVAGCGTNQALITALRFPQADVLGTDASENSLRICGENAASIGLANLTLRQEGIAAARYESRFDYIICTGVIHHNPDPSQCLARLAAALRPRGVLELMVYNAFHRHAPAAFQAALRVFGDDPRQASGTLSQADRLDLARRLAAEVPPGSILAADLAADYDNPSEAAWADTWINPCEHGYTAQGVSSMAAGFGLRIETTTPAGFAEVSGAQGAAGWYLPFTDPDLRARFNALDDQARWQAVNLLRYDQSPMLWFYLTRADDGPRVTDAERAELFLATVFRRNRTERGGFILDDATGGYRRVTRATPFPIGEPPDTARAVYQAAPGRVMREVLDDLGIDPAPDVVHRLRVELTTTAYPFLRADS